MEAAVERLYRAVSVQEPVCFYGDYDVDGIRPPRCTCPFLDAWAHRFGPMCRIVKREGYGLNAAAVQRLHDEGISLLVTSDCGTTSHHEIALASSSAWTLL